MMSRQARRRTVELVDPTPSDPGFGDDELGGAMDRLSVEQALDRLCDADQQVLRLRYDEDLTQLEVAHRLGVREGTAKVRLHRARHRLRELLEEPSSGSATASEALSAAR